MVNVAELLSRSLDLPRFGGEVRAFPLFYGTGEVVQLVSAPIIKKTMLGLFLGRLSGDMKN
jgi:hypothetical protein